MGVDMIELDVRPTFDNKVVVFHDKTLQRTTPFHGRVRNHTLAHLENINAGAWFGQSEYEQELIPSLAKALEQIDNRCEVLIEIKSEGRLVRVNFLRNLIHTIEAANARDRAIIQSFDTRILNKLQHYFPGYRYQKLIVVKLPGFRIQLDKRVMVEHILKKEHYESINVDHRFITKPFIQKIHRNRKKVFCWTVNDPLRMERLIEWGVDGIITNYPDRLKSILEKTNKLK